MQLSNPIAGGGKRRKSAGNWAALSQQLSAAQRDLAAAKEQIATLTAERDEARGRSDFHRNGWIGADREVRRLQVVLSADALLPANQAPAMVDRPDFEPAPADPPTPERDLDQLPPIALSLPRPETYEVANPNAETQPVPLVALDDTQPVDVRELRDLMGLGRTAVIPIVAVSSCAQIPAGPGSADPTEVSPATGRRATVSVADALGAAS